MVDARFPPLPTADELRRIECCGCPDCRGHLEGYKTMSPAVRAELETIVASLDGSLDWPTVRDAARRLRRLLEQNR